VLTELGLSLDELEDVIDAAPAEEKARLLKIVEELSMREERAAAQKDFLAFVKSVWPDFIGGNHHKRMAKLFEAVARGEKKRIIINLGPRHTKSEFASYLLPAWFLGQFPKKKIMQVSNTGELAEGFGRKVRNLVDSAEYKRIFPDTELRVDSKAAGRWNTNYNGEYFATGVNGTITGRGADLLIIDDPHSESEAVTAQFNPDVYDKVYNWYSSGPRQRLQPGGAIIIVMCMTGDTLVLMADKTEKPLRDIRPGDVVATFDNGRLTTAKVNNHQSNGVDSIYKIQTQSGRILRANERHPFLIMNEGVLEWTRLRELRRGDLLVSLKDATGQHGQKPNPESAKPANPKSPTIEKTQTPPTTSSDITGNGKVKRVLSRIAKSLSTAMVSALTIMQKAIGLPEGEEELLREIERLELRAGTGSLSKTTTECLSSSTAAVRYAEICPETMFGPIGAANCALTIAMTLEKFGGSSATTAISPLAMVRHQQYLNALQRTSDFTADPIISITYDGEEEVFDVEIDRTENFIANGVVSHNTRWSERDLTGQVLENSAKNNGDKWEVIEFPAILPSGKPLWPEFWPLEELEAVKAEIPTAKWMAQYQQQPTSETNAIIKREWWQPWTKKEAPKCDFVLMSMDTAFEKKNSADYSAITIFGVWYNDEDGGQPNLVLLEAWRERLEFPDLKKTTLEFYQEWEPDGIIIEKKATGAPLIYELRRSGIPVQEFTPSRGQDKVTRLNAIADIFASKKVWAPQTRWADEVINEVAAFPSGRNDDFVDCVSLALARFRSGGFIGTVRDEPDEDYAIYKTRKASYY